MTPLFVEWSPGSSSSQLQGTKEYFYSNPEYVHVHVTLDYSYMYYVHV